MLIFLDSNNLPKDKIIVKVPWDGYFHYYKVTKYFDDSDIKIVRDIEPTSLLNTKEYTMPIGVESLSDGCKTLLCINHAIKTKTIDNFVFNISSCDSYILPYINEVLASNIDITVYTVHYEISSLDNSNNDSTKKFITNSDDYEIELNLRGKYTVLCADNYKGKSLLFEQLTKAHNTDDIILLDYNTLKPKGNYKALTSILQSTKNKIIVIHQFNDILSERTDVKSDYPDIVDIINLDKGNNHFILTNRQLNLRDSLSVMAILGITNNSKLTLNYIINE